MNLPPSGDALTTAFAIAVCDLLVTERAKFQSLLQLLERKGLVSSAELLEASQSIAALDQESIQQDAQRLQQTLRDRMQIRLNELLLRSMSDEPTQ